MILHLTAGSLFYWKPRLRWNLECILNKLLCVYLLATKETAYCWRQRCDNGPSQSLEMFVWLFICWLMCKSMLVGRSVGWLVVWFGWYITISVEYSGQLRCQPFFLVAMATMNSSFTSNSQFFTWDWGNLTWPIKDRTQDLRTDSPVSSQLNQMPVGHDASTMRMGRKDIGWGHRTLVLRIPEKYIC